MTPFNLDVWLTFALLLLILTLFEKHFGRHLLALMNVGLMLICIDYGCRMKTEFLTNKISKFPYSSNEAIANAIT